MARSGKLKPPHGWNEVGWDLAIVVLGVLIALGAQQAVDAWQWRQKVGVVRQSIMSELGNNRARWEENLVAVRCASQEIDRLDAWAAAPPGPPPPDISTIAGGRVFSTHTANWVLATNSLTMDHFPMREQLAFASLYDGIDHRQVSITAVTDDFDRIQTLVPLASNPTARLELREAIGGARREIASLIDNEGYMQRHFDAVGVKPDRSDFAADVTGSGCGMRRSIVGASG
jgi:hypothetical protein